MSPTTSDAKLRRIARALVKAAFNGAIAECADMFGVSENAMHWRLYNVGLAAERPE